MDQTTPYDSKERSNYENTILFANAFTTVGSSNHFALKRALHNVVKIVDLSSHGRGFGLVATQPISRGQVVFTETAALASQIPQQQRRQHSNSGKEKDASSPFWPVRACQCCFRSLEPASACQGIFAQEQGNNNDDENDDNAATSSSANTKEERNNNPPPLPNAYLWPVPGLAEASRCRQFMNTTSNKNNESYRLDEFGHYACCHCQMLFCSLSCQERFQNELGSCCSLAASMNALLNLLQLPKRPNIDDNNNHNCELETEDGQMDDQRKDDNNDDDEPSLEVQAPVVLAIRMLAWSLQHFRTTKSRPNKNTTTCMDGLCGEPSDINPLELGWNEANDECCGNTYSLKPLYHQLVSIWDITEVEQEEAVSLPRFQQMAAMAGRNGIGFHTQNPFEAYYSSLIRSTGGRNSVNHPTVMANVSRALGCPPAASQKVNDKDDNNNNDASVNVFGLQRGMDSRIRERVTPELVAVFPLTARINHSCQPSCHIASQSFIDAHIDLVAQQDIATGEEITISYIYTGNSSRGGIGGESVMEGRRQSGKSRVKRQRELQAKYLFLCCCPLCSPTTKTSECDTHSQLPPTSS